MTGAASTWPSERVKEFQQPKATNEQGSFTLRLLIDETPLVFELSFDFVQGAVAYRTSSPSLGGVVDGWNCPPSVKRFLSPSFASLFVFDGEFANRLLDARQSEAERAIDALCQLDLLDRAAQVAEADWQDRVRSQGAKTTQGLAMHRKRERHLLEREEKLVKLLGKLQADYTRLSTETAALGQLIDERVSANQLHRARYEQLTLAVAQHWTSLVTASLNAMSHMRKPHYLDNHFASALAQFRESLDRAKLPEASSKQFFLDLAEGADCVCGRAIGPLERERILDQASQYLGDDIAGVINSIKSSVSEALAAEHSPLESSIQELTAARNNYHITKTDLEAVKAEALGSGADGGVEGTQQTISENEKQLKQWKDHIDEITRAARSTDDEESFCLASIRKQLAQAREKIAEISETVLLRRQTDAIKRLAEEAKLIARERIRGHLLTDCNERLSKILAGNPIAISQIGKNLELEAQRGASVGQTLAVGYTFLTSVLHRGAHEFPLIVDSPAGSLDDLVRREIGAMVPTLCAQFVAFMISTERSDFMPALERTAGEKNIRYLTIFRKTEGTKPLLKSLPSKNVHQTDNAVIVDGRDYFNQFKLVSYDEGK
jgi:DNA sulfur modification protein DndD